MKKVKLLKDQTFGQNGLTESSTEIPSLLGETSETINDSCESEQNLITFILGH